MENKTEKKIEGKEEGKVLVVKYNGTGGWHISKAEGMEPYGPGDLVEFNLNDKEDLAAVLGVLKNINSRGYNKRSVVDKNSDERYKYVMRYEIISGLEHLPDVLKKIVFNERGRYTPSEQKAITQFCPDFFKKEEVLYKVQAR